MLDGKVDLRNHNRIFFFKFERCYLGLGVEIEELDLHVGEGRSCYQEQDEMMNLLDFLEKLCDALLFASEKAPRTNQELGCEVQLFSNILTSVIAKHLKF